MSDDALAQLRMVWPAASPTLPAIQLPPGYRLYAEQVGNESDFFALMTAVNWPGWDSDKLQPWRERLLSEGWFWLIHLASGQLVASSMALRDCREFGEQGGEIGWIAVDPAHRGLRLGTAVTIAATQRCLQEGYRHVHLYTEDWRLPALKIYLRLGYKPLLYAPDMAARWRAIAALYLL
jgi:mycothiol synthase